MNPIYKFELDRNGEDRRQAYPNYKTDLAMEFAKENQQQFFRRKLSGKLTFLSEDYIFISQTTFDTKFGLFISISYDLGQTWSPYWQGMFWKTDCEFSEDDQTVVVAPSADDLYGKVLDGIEKEYDLIKLAPQIVPIHYDKRPMLQIYVAGQDVVGCFLSGVWWEEQTEEPTTNVVELENTYHFAKIGERLIITNTNVQFPLVPSEFYGPMPVDYFSDWDLYNGDFRLHHHFSNNINHYDIYYENEHLWGNQTYDGNIIVLNPISGTIASGTVRLSFNSVGVWARLVCNVDSIGGVSTYDIPATDIVANNRNYRKCIGYSGSDMILFSDRLSNTPTEYGIYQPGVYYDRPLTPLYYGELYPCARKGWERLSVWFRPDLMDALIEEQGRAPSVLNDAYPLGSAISVLLNEIAPDITFEETAEYSEFLYGVRNPITAIVQSLFITPKSNVINSGYDQPAQKAPITLKTILDMLRDCFRCFWFVEDGKFRIEHISYFQNGGTYTGSVVIGRDLTQEQVTRNGKPWSFGKNAYSFDKPDSFGRYQFEWMDDVTQQFEGFPIDILSGYVNKASIEQVSVSQFTSDIDFILLNPSTISQDGFVLLSAVNDNGNWVLPYVNFIYNYTDHILQNAYVAFMFLQNYYLFDMPAPDYMVNGEQKRAIDTRRLRLQEIQFPCLVDPEETKLIKTGLGLGILEKISVNLSSRNGKATLKFPTQ